MYVTIYFSLHEKCIHTVDETWGLMGIVAYNEFSSPTLYFGTKPQPLVHEFKCLKVD